MNFEEKKISGEVMFDGKIFRVEKDIVLCPNGKEAFREIIRHNGGAGVLAVTDDDKVILIRQFRYAYNEVMYEIPAGKLEVGEDPLFSALREFEEETGNKADKVEYLMTFYPTCGYCSEKIYLYLVTNFKATETHFDEDEVIETCYIDYDEVLEMIKDGIIKDGKTIAAVMNYHIRYRMK